MLHRMLLVVLAFFSLTLADSILTKVQDGLYTATLNISADVTLYFGFETPDSSDCKKRISILTQGVQQYVYYVANVLVRGDCSKSEMYFSGATSCEKFKNDFPDAMSRKSLGLKIRTVSGGLAGMSTLWNIMMNT